MPPQVLLLLAYFGNTLSASVSLCLCLCLSVSLSRSLSHTPTHTHTHTHKDTQPTRPRPPPPPRAPGPMAPHTRDPFPTPFRRDTHCTREKTIRQTDSGSGLGVAEGKVPRLPAPATNGSGCLGIGRWPGWVRLLAASGDTGRLWRRPWTGDKARDEPSPPPCLPLPGRPRRALGAGSPGAWSLSRRPPAACSHGADAHAHAHAHAHYWRGPATEAAGAAGEALCGPRPWVHGWFSGRILTCQQNCIYRLCRGWVWLAHCSWPRLAVGQLSPIFASQNQPHKKSTYITMMPKKEPSFSTY